MKICSTCKQLKAISAFGPRKRNLDGLEYSCRECINLSILKYRLQNPYKIKELQKKWRNSNKNQISERNRRWRLKKLYNITQEQYNEILLCQNNGCAICGIMNNGIKAFHVDHDHLTGSVRGILCTKCNTALGSYELIKDKAEIYLRRRYG